MDSQVSISKMLKIREVSVVNANDLEQLNNLIPQLSQSAKPMDQSQFNEIVIPMPINFLWKKII